MKRVLPAAAGVLLMAAVILLIFAWREIGMLRDELAALRKERGAPASRHAPATNKVSPLSGKQGSTAAEAKSAKSGEEESTGEKKDGTMDLLMGAGEKEVRQRSEARIAMLKERLKLRPEQVEALKKHASTRGDALLSAFERVRSSSARPPDFGVLMDWISGRFDLPVTDALDASQRELFEHFETEERASRIENLVNMELVELSGEAGIHLTPEQKDQVFDRLTEITAAEDAMGDAYFADDAQFQARIDESLRRRREAMQTIFDDSQMQNYDRVLAADRVLIMDLFGGEKGASQESESR